MYTVTVRDAQLLFDFDTNHTTTAVTIVVVVTILVM